MKYAFKPAKSVDTTIITRSDNQSSTELRLENEVRAHMRSRVIGAVEASWNLFEFRMVRLSPTVTTLDLHLSGERVLLIRNTRLPPGLKPSNLERYFKRPSRYSNMTYMEYYESVKLYEKLPRSLSGSDVIQDHARPRNYIVDRDGENDRIVTRIRSVSPTKPELFSLRLLLMDTPFSSFDEAKVHGSTNYETYREAAVARGLYAEGDEFQKAFDEAVRYQSTPGELRCMLVTMYQQGGDPRHAMNKHKSYLMSDIREGSDAHKLRELFRRVIQISDRHGGKLLREHNYFAQTAQEMGIASRTEVEREQNRIEDRNDSSERSSATLRERYDSLKPGQKEAFDTIHRAVTQRSVYSEDERRQRDAKVFFLQGHAGTGKTYLLSLLRDRVEKDGYLVKMTATTGIAASLYEGGSTLHSLLGIGVDDNKDASTRTERPRLSKYGPRTQRARLLRKMMLLIVDEASMMARILFEVMDAILKDLRESRTYFSGLIIVFAGDYMQLLPVVPASRTVVGADGQQRVIPVNLLDHIPWYSSDLWKDKVRVLRLTEQVRQESDPNFAQLLLKLGKGTFPAQDRLPLLSTEKRKESYKHLWKWVSSKDPRDVRLNRLLVAPTNSLVDEHNYKALDMFPGDSFSLSSATRLEKTRRTNNTESDGILLPEMTYNYCPTGVPPHNLILKKGVPVMVIRNVLHPHLVNGKIFIVTGHSRRCLFVKQIDSDGRTISRHALHRIDFQFTFSDVKVTRRQFPVRLAFAATVHKAQGQTLKKVVVDFRTNFFAPGQVYVALSRARKAHDVLLLHDLDDDLPLVHLSIHQMPVVVKNPVLKEAIEFVEGQRE